LKGFASTRGKVLSVAVATLAVAAPTGFTSLTSSASAATGSLTGAGSTLVAPLEAAWASAYQKSSGNSVSYSPVGSGTGITDMTNRSVDFGASDAPLTPTQASACNGCVTIPWALTATGVGYNVPGVKGNLKLTGPVIAQIFLGQITTWNNSAIKKLNPGVKLPSTQITTVHRADGSGDTYAFVNYLDHVSSAASSKLGPAATSVSWPGGVAETGNGGVVSEIKATPGAIGYAAVYYLISQRVFAAAVKNAAGKYEYPNLNNIANAASTVKSVPSSGVVPIVDPPKKAKIAYPISTFTYAVVPTSGNKQAALLKSFINFDISTGQSFGPKLDFVPLPKVVVKADKAMAGRLS
jgi:phosphate transport system substrate-binding protein